MSQDLFAVNRPNLTKIFESHQIRGSILFTDVLKICTATRIFPNLLTSKHLRKLIIQVTKVVPGDELSAKLNYFQLEEFLRGVAEYSYPGRRGISEQYKMLFLHMRNPCYLRYNIILDAEDKNKKEQSFNVKTSHGVYFQPSNDRKVLNSYSYRSPDHKKPSNLNSLVSPRNNFSGFHLRVYDESSRDSSAQPSPKVFNTDRPELNRTLSTSKENLNTISNISEVFNNFKEKTQDLFNLNKRIGVKEIKIMAAIRQKEVSKSLKLKLAFNLWKASKI
jgi:hypothetical protein